MPPAARHVLPASPPGVNRVLYLFRGRGLKAADAAYPSGTALSIRAGAEVVLENGPEESELLMLQGRPIAEPVVHQLKTSGRVERGLLGVQIQPVTDEIASSLSLGSSSGALVAQVEPDSAAQKAGVQEGDVIKSVDGKNIATVRELTRTIAAFTPGSTVKLGLLRDVTTTTQMFRQLVNELTLLLTYEATKDLADEEVEIETPLEQTTARRISGKKVAICPILRAGVGMLDGVLSLIPGARVGFIGLYRDEETLEAVEYFVKLPGDIADRDVILLDPMLATGNSTAAAVETVKRGGATSVRLIALIAAPEGIRRIHRDHPDVSIVVAAVDRALNEKGYIVPGLGDAGDRLYGTK